MLQTHVRNDIYNKYCLIHNTISRSSLWFKMIKSGIDGKLFDLVRSMYDNIKLQVKYLGSLSDLFSCDVGLLQGEIISPFLFALFIDDIEMKKT